MPSKKKQAASTTPDLIAAECLAVRVRLLSRTISGIYDDALRPLGLTAGQLNILVVIARRAPISPRAIGRRLNMEKSTVSRNVERMRRNGWLTVALAESGRGQRLTLSRAGRKLIEESLPAWQEAQTKANALLGQRGADSIHRLGSETLERLARD